MQGNYALKDGDLILGIFTIDSERNLVKYKPEAKLKKQPLIFRLFIEKFGYMSNEVAYDWLINRAPESDYEFIKVLLKRIGATAYDPFLFIEHNNGRFITDDYYLEKL